MNKVNRNFKKSAVGLIHTIDFSQNAEAVSSHRQSPAEYLGMPCSRFTFPDPCAVLYSVGLGCPVSEQAFLFPAFVSISHRQNVFAYFWSLFTPKPLIGHPLQLSALKCWEWMGVCVWVWVCVWVYVCVFREISPLRRGWRYIYISFALSEHSH